MTTPIGWNTGPQNKQSCAWTSVSPFGLAQPITINDTVLADIVVEDEFPSWCVDDWYAPVIHDGLSGESPL